MYDFYSDTKTKPSRAMREAAVNAEVGDEQSGEDPTTNALCQRVAALLGKDAALFLPSGTMCNEIAIRVHTSPGDEIICDRTCHIINFEGGAPAMMSGVMVRTLDGENGIFNAAQVAEAIRAPNRYAPASRLLCVEQTANLGGGAIWPATTIAEVAATARDAGLATHMDGARLMNAVVASKVTAAEFAEPFDSCWIDFSKGLGAPVGAVLAGSEPFIAKAWRVKQQIGGAMRQSGILAAMCLHALDHNIERMADDHQLARKIADRLKSHPLVATVLPVATNIVFFDLSEEAPDASQIADRLRADGVLIGAFGRKRMRIVTHLDVDDEAANALCDALSRQLN